MQNVGLDRRFAIRTAATLATPIFSEYHHHSQRHDMRPRFIRRGDRAADCAGLENQCGGNLTEGSNPSLSAS